MLAAVELPQASCGVAGAVGRPAFLVLNSDQRRQAPPWRRSGRLFTPDDIMPDDHDCRLAAPRYDDGGFEIRRQPVARPRRIACIGAPIRR